MIFVTGGGGTRPWAALNQAFANADASAIFFMTDGNPNLDRNGGRWNINDYIPTADTYIEINNKRTEKLSVNTVSVGQSSAWLEMISNGASGTYKVIN